MNHFDVIQSFLGLCERSASSAEVITAGFREAVESLGFRYFACFSHIDPLDPPGNAILIHNYPADWARQYGERGLYRIDPVFRHAQVAASPFSWDEALCAAQLTKAQEKMIAEAASLGLAHGYTLPINSSWLPGSLRASCSVVPESPERDAARYATLKVLAHFLYASVTSAGSPAGPLPFAPLTPRERQCVALIAQGKDEWTIGRILGVSSATVHYHIGRLKRRFQVSTGAQAGVSAVMTGQLSYHDVYRRTEPAGRRIRSAADTRH